MYNPTQKNLLVAQEYATQLRKRLEIALHADEFKDEPELRPGLRKLFNTADKLSEEISAMRESYDDSRK